MDKKKWSRYVEARRGSDTNSQVASVVGVDPATVGRWLSGRSEPQLAQVIAFGRAYDSNPLTALLAAEYLTPDDLGATVTVDYPTSLDDYSTAALLREIEKRLEHMADYAGWIRAIATGETSPANLSADVLRYIDPTQAPDEVRGENFIDAIEQHVTKTGSVDGVDIYGLRPPARDVGTLAEDDLHVTDLTQDELGLAASHDESVVDPEREP